MRNGHFIIFDIGKTNKKCLLFDSQLNLVDQRETQIPEIDLERGEKAEDIKSLQAWIKDQYALFRSQYTIVGLNVSAYGASIVHLNTEGKAVMPMQNYLTPFPSEQEVQFKTAYDQEVIQLDCGTHMRGNLNTGLQLFALKRGKPDLFEQIVHSVHLPQYLLLPFAQKPSNDLSALGCHSLLWNFDNKEIHSWALEEGIAQRLAPIRTDPLEQNGLTIGPGIHDSSAAFFCFRQLLESDFLLLSTGTWSVAMQLKQGIFYSKELMDKGALMYLQPDGEPLIAASWIMGKQHEQGVDDICNRYGCGKELLLESTFTDEQFEKRNAADTDPVLAYYRLMWSIVSEQLDRIGFLHPESKSCLVVDGGFSRNELFMNMLRRSLPEVTIYATELGHGAALGAALQLTEYRPANGIERLQLKEY